MLAQSAAASVHDRCQDLRCLLEVDGGIKSSNIKRVVEAGADIIVVGFSDLQRRRFGVRCGRGASIGNRLIQALSRRFQRNASGMNATAASIAARKTVFGDDAES